MKKGSTRVADDHSISSAGPDNTGQPRELDERTPIVGLGASAGGIVALGAFFESMPSESGMAFVVILHLSPTQESTLVEMFQRWTTMRVVAATDGAVVLPNCVYVIPPGTFLAAAGDGHLRLAESQEPRGKRIEVDSFFRALAESHGPRAIAVVLSGAGGDGALGLKRVKELGGLTIAQDPNEAEHPDMPRAAIATGVVDWVLGVADIGAKLVEYVNQRRRLNLPDEEGPHPAGATATGPDEGEAALRDVLSFLHTRTGRDFSSYKRATILRRIARRMQVNGISDLPAYLAYLRVHAGEAGALLQDLLIAVTNFFRDPQSFDVLERTMPELFKGKGPGEMVRVWIAGCATGEEAYSIAILLYEHAATLIGPPQIQIFATDLDESVIREAREGLYPETIAADISEERLRRFFIKEKNGYRVRRAVRELLLFAPHDLLKDSPFSRLDLVSCRNLLIYLNREAQSRAFDIFHFALRPGGVLFLGTSESVEEGSSLFAVLDKKHRLYISRPGPQRVLAIPSGPGILARALAIQGRTQERETGAGSMTAGSLQSALDRSVPFDSGLAPSELHYRLIERFAPPSILINSAHDIVHLSESAGRYLRVEGGEPTRNLLRMVHPMLRVELRAVIYAATNTQAPATAFDVPVELGDVHLSVNIRVTPARDLAPDFLLVVFEEQPAGGQPARSVARSDDADHAAIHLERELVATKQHLREVLEQSKASTEELKASNEELQAMNEELRSATEELEASREELQSINEELTSVNDELKSNVEQLANSNNDLHNLMAATDIATVFLNRELRILRFTPSAKTLFSFISTDVGRPLSDLSRQLEYPEIVSDAELALKHLRPAEREVSAGERWYIARTLPYCTADDHIAGVVMTFTETTSIKQAEDAKGQLAAIVESSSDAIIGKDLRGIITSWNAGAENMFGYTAAEIVGQPVTRLIPGVLQAEEDMILARISEGSTIKSLDTVRLRKDGTKVPVSETISPIRNAAGKIIGASKISRDMSDSKRAEAALRESEARSAFVRRSSGVGFWYCDLPFDVLQWDDLVKEHFHLPPDAPVTIETFYERLHPDDRETTRLAIQKSITEHESYDIDYRTVHPDTGAVKWVRAIGRTSYAADGTPIRFDGVTLDVSERKQAQEEIARLAADARKQQRLYETVLTNTPDFMYVFSLDHRVIYANEALIKMWGRGHEGAIGKTFLEIGYEPWHAAMHEREIDQVRATGLPVRGEVPFTGTLGRRQYEYIFVPVIGVNGEVEAVAGTTRDVTERREKEEQLREGQQQLDFALSAADLGQWSLNLADLTASRTLRHDQIFGYETPLPIWTFETFLEHVVPEDRDSVRESFRKALATGAAWTVECRIRRADGAERRIWTKAHIRRDAEGEVDRMLGIIGDITERRQAEDRQSFLVRLGDALRPLSDPAEVQAEASRLLATQIRANRVAYFEVKGGEYVVDRDYAEGAKSIAGRYPAASFGAEMLAAYHAGRRVSEADVEANPAITPAQREAFAAVQIRSYFGVPLVKGGKFVAGLAVHSILPRIWAPHEIALIEDAAERTWAAVERVRAEAALRASEEGRRLALDAAELGTFHIDIVANEVTCDERFRVICTGTAEVMDLEQMFAAVHPEDRARIREALAAATNAEYPIPYSEEYRVIHPDGSVRWVCAKGRAAVVGRALTTQRVSLNGTVEDISDQVRARTELAESEERYRLLAASLEAQVERRTAELEVSNRQLRLAERMAALGTLSAGLGHDMGNLLVPIRVRLESLASADLSESSRKDLEVIQTSTEYLRKLSSGLRLLALDPDRTTSEESTDLRLWWEEAEPMLRNVLPRGIALASRVADGSFWASISRPAITQAVFNLVQNAGDVMRARGRGTVTVWIESQGDSVLVGVSDDGPGMPPDVRARCMEPFFTTKTREISTGLGLALVYGIIHKAKGSIAIDSAVGRGTTFTLTLRRAEASPAKNSLVGAAGRAARVSLRDARLRAFVTGELRSMGFKVEEDTSKAADLFITDAMSALGEVAQGRPVIFLGDAAGAAQQDVTAVGEKPSFQVVRTVLRTAAEGTKP